jgi:hypothetical protein
MASFTCSASLYVAFTVRRCSSSVAATSPPAELLRPQAYGSGTQAAPGSGSPSTQSLRGAFSSHWIVSSGRKPNYARSFRVLIGKPSYETSVG